MKTMFNEFILELDFNIINTEYSINNHPDNIVSYDFLSKNNNSYSVYFLMTTEENELLSDGTMLGKYTNLTEIPTIFFSLSNRKFDDNFNELTNNKEYLEVMGKVIFMILEFIKKNKYSVYSIGEVGDKKINFYNNYRKFFNEFKILTGESANYIDNGKKLKAYYLIKTKSDLNIKDILKLDEHCYLKIKNNH